VIAQVRTDLEAGASRMMLIGGELVRSRSGRTMPVISPGDGRSLGDVPAADAGDVATAVEAAAAAFESWRFTDLGVRRQCVSKLAAAIGADAENLAYLDAVDSGSPIGAMRQDAAAARFAVEFFGGLAFSWGGRSVPVMGRAIDYTVREPYGVTARIVPFNHPLVFAAWKIIPPLLTGNTVVLKLPDQTPLSGLRLAEQLAEIFPPGVVNVITGDGAEAGAALVAHTLVRRVAFIGSVPTGTLIAKAAAERLVPVSMELGGKNPMVVCADADPEEAAHAAVAGMNFSTQGQSCGSYSRLFLHEDVHDVVVEAVVNEVRNVRVSHPLDETADMGALIDAKALDRITSHVARAVDQGASVAAGGERLTGGILDGGFYYAPTVLTGVRSSMPVARTELFGPVVSVLRWKDPDQLLTELNDTQYGLTANIHTNDLQLAYRLAERIESGSIAINGDGSQHWFGAPFGGFKSSGFGKEDTIDELIDSTREKNLNFRLRP
jgi:betaine-aldehyde dehydrogenase